MRVVVDVSAQTIGNWERGDQPPNAPNREAIIDTIPENLTPEEVLEAEDRFDEDGDWTHKDEQRLFGSDLLQRVRGKPRVPDEIEGGAGISAFTDRQRMFIERLDLTGVQGDVKRDHERVTTVIYLAGDERRALRRFIDENERIVHEQLQDEPNRFSHDWDEWLYGLLEQEFRFRVYE
jgi:hypothetical protein